jgi:hypothetical protein
MARPAMRTLDELLAEWDAEAERERFALSAEPDRRVGNTWFEAAAREHYRQLRERRDHHVVYWLF